MSLCRSLISTTESQSVRRSWEVFPLLPPFHSLVVMPVSQHVDIPSCISPTHHCPGRLSLMKLHLAFSKIIQKVWLSQANTITDDSVLLGEPPETTSKPRDLKRTCFKILSRPGIKREAYWLMWHLPRYNILVKCMNSGCLPFSYWGLSVMFTINLPSVIGFPV